MKAIESNGFIKLNKDSNSSKSKSDSEKNPYAICTESIGKSEGTTERSEWSQDAKKRYDDCIDEVDNKESSNYSKIKVAKNNKNKSNGDK